MNYTLNILLAFFFCSTAAKSQISFQTKYQIKNNTNLSVFVNYTVTCNKNTENNEAKMIPIPAGASYTVPAPFFNSARFYSDCDIHIEVPGLFGSKVVDFSNQTSRYNEDNSLHNTENKLKPVGIIIWEPTITNIW